MRITVRLRLREPVDIADFQRKYGNVARWAYNRALDGMGKFEIFKLIPAINNADELDRSWKEQAVKDGYGKAQSAIARARKEAKDSGEEYVRPSVIFGGRGLFYKRLRGRIDREEFLRERKPFPVTCEGSRSDSRGNRKFKFDPVTLTGTVMTDRGKVPFSCFPTSRGNMRLLLDLQERIMRGECGMTCRITPEYFYVVFDVEKSDVEEKYAPDRRVTLGIDMNPNYIGLSVADGESVLLRRAYDLTGIRGNNKRKYELTQIVLDIKGICRRYRVSAVGYEELTMPASDKGKGRRFNRQVNNEWCREYFVNSLRKHMALVGCRCYEIAPQYSSFIGCMMHPEETDSVAASMEINRRLRKYINMFVDRTEPQGSVVFPEVPADCLNRWKEEGGPMAGATDWRDAWQRMKKSKSSYRLLYPDFVERNQVAVSRLKSWMSRVTFVSLDDKIPYLS